MGEESKFKVGNIIELIDNSNMSAKIGIKAKVIKIDGWMNIEWLDKLNESKRNGQMNGGYRPEIFKLVEEKEFEKRQLKVGDKIKLINIYHYEKFNGEEAIITEIFDDKKNEQHFHCQTRKGHQEVSVYSGSRTISQDKWEFVNKSEKRQPQIGDWIKIINYKNTPSNNNKIGKIIEVFNVENGYFQLDNEIHVSSQFGDKWEFVDEPKADGEALKSTSKNIGETETGALSVENLETATERMNSEYRPNFDNVNFFYGKSLAGTADCDFNPYAPITKQPNLNTNKSKTKKIMKCALDVVKKFARSENDQLLMDYCCIDENGNWLEQGLESVIELEAKERGYKSWKKLCQKFNEGSNISDSIGVLELDDLIKKHKPALIEQLKEDAEKEKKSKK